ncbi:TPA: hypothetical protein EYO12_00535 [Candidatus Saccharibacteria bacterium]|nr:hypothetical protein [Candidatus Saccharibacteria bacterium]HIO87582.1 hypothetical protein [Candidatus Saccharibacteria bacterium]
MTANKRVKVLLTGGGSGGHTTPLVAVGKALESMKNIDIVAIGEKSIPAQPIGDYKTYYISAGKFRRYNALGWRQYINPRLVYQNLRDLFKVCIGIFESMKILRKVKPDVIFIKGGYVSLPVGLAARLLNIRYVTHDSDLLPGLTNRILSKGAHYNLVGFPIENYSYDKSKTIQVGVPIREVFRATSKASARKKLKIPSNAKHIMIIGGSNGAKIINDAVLRVADKLSGLAYVTHQVGAVQEQEIATSIKSKKIKKYAVFGFMDANSYSAHLASADVVISRAGATAVSELAYLKKASIIVPNPLLTGGHQLKNANVIQSNDACRLLHEATMSHDPNLLVVYSDELLANTKESAWLGNNLHKLFKHDAQKQTAKILVDLAHETATTT